MQFTTKTNLSKRVFESAPQGDAPPSEWQEIADALVACLGTTLGIPLVVDARVAPSLGHGFSVDVCATPDILGLRVRGIVGADLVNERLVPRAWIFLYSEGTLLMPRDGGEFLSCEYLATDVGGQWEVLGWGTGEPGEFDAFLTHAFDLDPS